MTDKERCRPASLFLRVKKGRYPRVPSFCIWGKLFVVHFDQLEQMLVALLGVLLVLCEQNGSTLRELAGQTAVTSLVHQELLIAAGARLGVERELLIGSGIIDKTSFSVPSIVDHKSTHGKTVVNGMVRGTINGTVRGMIHATVEGDVDLNVISGSVSEGKEEEDDEA